ncbi:MAG TPA: 3-hydroxybutyryl-CoA dehydrogenase, partial [Planctomycetota bacterium]|nr:3-hydroxybutyryl-CoA dehydrogenase [Planctomycetota bacterium]
VTISTVGVIGCGLMGSGIAQVCAQNGYRTIVREVSEEFLSRGLGRIRSFLDQGVKRGKVAQADADKTLANLSGTTSLADLKDCDVVVEAVVENLEEKRKVFAELDRVCKASAILASNTSSILISDIGSATKRPDRIIGIHFMQPVPIMKLVEIVRPDAASESTYAEARKFAESLGKTTITAKDTPGFIVNLLLVPYLCDAVRALEKGLATKEDIDTGMELGCGMPMGPIKLADFVGLDTALHITEVLHEGLGDPKYAPPEMLKQLVKAGKLGKKTGAGFYTYAPK